jgi:hypothetical protein
VTVYVAAVDTVVVVMVKVFEIVCPAGTITVEGTLTTAGLELDKLTVRSAGAALLRVTRLFVVELPPPTLLGKSESEFKRIG